MQHKFRLSTVMLRILGRLRSAREALLHRRPLNLSKGKRAEKRGIKRVLFDTLKLYLIPIIDAMAHPHGYLSTTDQPPCRCKYSGKIVGSFPA